MNVRFPSASDYVGALAEGGPGSRLALTQVRADQQCEFLNEIGRALRQYEDADGVAIPIGYLVLTARP